MMKHLRRNMKKTSRGTAHDKNIEVYKKKRKDNAPQRSASRKQNIQKQKSDTKINTLTRVKARKILHDKKVRGQKITEKQRKFFGSRASGYPIRRKKR